MKKVRVRIGPSPSGDPHVGTAYISLFNYIFAKKYDGSFIIRIEDTDQKRSNKSSEIAILDSLKWLGLQWDEGPDIGGEYGPYKQSERIDIYKKYVIKLVEKNSAYWCSCTPQRLAHLKEYQQKNGQSSKYDGYCLKKTKSQVKKEISKSIYGGVVRLKVKADKLITFSDMLRGNIVINSKEIDDQILLKSDGYPTYHLANVIDDYLMKITHVFRGEEWITSTPKHILLYEELGWKPPFFCHLPLLRDKNKNKLSKRNLSVSIDFYRKNGFLPESLINLLGLNAYSLKDENEIFSLEKFIKNFSLKSIPLGGPVFDVEKLKWLNGIYLREKYSDEDWIKHIYNNLFDFSYMKKIIPLIKNRVETFDEFLKYSDFFFKTEISLKDINNYIINGYNINESVSIYELILAKTSTIDVFSELEIKKILKNLCKEKDIKNKDLFIPIRIGIMGSINTPPLFSTIAVLGKTRFCSRINAIILFLKKNNK